MALQAGSEEEIGQGGYGLSWSSIRAKIDGGIARIYRDSSRMMGSTKGTWAHFREAGVKTLLTEFFNTIVAMVRDKIGDLLTWAIPVSLITICICMLINYKGKAYAMIDTVISIASSIFSAIGLSIAGNMAKIWSVLRRFFKPERELFESSELDQEEEAINEDDITLQAGASNPFAILTSFAVLLSTNSEMSTGAIMKAMQSACRIVPVITSLSKVALWATNYLPKALANYAVIFFGYVTPSDFSIGARQNLAMANDLKARYDVDKETAFQDPDFVASVLRVHGELNKLMSVELLAYSAESHKRVYYREAIASLSGLVAAAKERTSQEMIRLEPLGVWISGPPGVGKTTIIRTLVASVHTTAHEYDLVYTKNIAEKFWSGYKGQKAVLVDDFGVHDSEVAKSFNGNVLTYMSSQSGAILDMPFEKGTKFTSESMWLTGNGKFDAPIPGIKVNDAFTRRFPVQVRMVLKDGYADAKGHLDMARYQAMTRDEVKRQDHCIFQRSVKRGKRVTTEELSYPQLALLIKAELAKKKKIFGVMVERSKNSLAEGIPEEKAPSDLDEGIASIIPNLDREHAQGVWTTVVAKHPFPMKGPTAKKTSFMRAFFKKNFDEDVDLKGLSVAQLHLYLTGALCTCYDDTESKECVVCVGDAPTLEVGDWLAKDVLEMTDVMNHADELTVSEPRQEMVSVGESLRRWRLSLANYFMSRKFGGFSLKNIIAVCLSVGAVVAVASIFSKPKCLIAPDEDDACVLDCMAPDIPVILFGDSADFADLQAQYGGAKTRIQNFRKARGVRDVEKRRVVPKQAQHALLEAGPYTPEHRLTEVKTIQRNLTRLVINGSCVNVIMLSGTVGMTVNHIFHTVEETGIEMVPKGTPMTLKSLDQSYDMEFDPSLIVRFKVGETGLFNEVCSYDFGAHVPSFRDITKYFIDEEQIQNRRSLKMLLLRLQANGSGYATRAGNTIACSDRVAIPSAIGRGDKHQANTTEILHRWDYDVVTQTGDCGSLGISAESATNAIVCMHFAYNNSSRRGMGVTLSKNVVVTHLSAHSANITLEAGSAEYFSQVVYEEKQPDALHPRVASVGFIDDPLLPGGATKTRLVESLFKSRMGEHCNAYGPATLGPSKEDPANTVDKIVARDMCRISEPEEHVDPRILSTAISDVLQEIVDNGSHGPLRTLTKDEVINGGGGFPHLKGMVMSTSAGYDPRLVEPGVGTKKSNYFTQRPDGGYAFGNLTASELFDSDSEALLRGSLPVYIWSVSLKDELRSKAKNEAGLTRNINCSPMLTTCMTRKFFGSFINSFMSLDPTTSFSAVGLNVYSPSYHTFVQDKLRIGANGFDGDLTKFESTFTPQVLEAIRAGIERMFYQNADGGEKARKALFKDLTHTYFRVGSKLFRKQAWNPSGTVLTTAINTVWTATLMRIAWIKIMMKNNARLSSLTCFHRLVADASFGDDNRSNVAEEVAHLYNRKFVTEALRPHGIIMTGAAKTADDGGKLMFHTELEFLKGMTAVGVLGDPVVRYTFDTIEESLFKSLLYVSNKQDFNTANIVNGSNMLRRAFTKGPKYFATQRNFVLSVLQETIGFSDHLITYDDCARQFYRNTLFDEDDVIACIEEDYSYQCAYGKDVTLQSGKAGVTFTDPASIETNYTRPLMAGDAVVDNTIVENQLSMNDLVARPQFVSSIDWTTSQVSGSVIQSFVLPRDVLTSRVMADPFSRFKYWRGTMNVAVRLQCTAFHAGMIRVFFQPLDAELGPSRTSASVCQGFNMVAGSTQVGTLRIPFVHPQTYMETQNPTIPLGTVHVMVFNNLRVGTVDAQAHQCTLSTYVHIEDAEFKVLDPTTDNAKDAIILQGGLMSKVTNNNIKLAAGATYVSHGDSDNFEGKTSNKVSGLDKPNIGIEAPPVRRRFAPDLATAANVGYKPVLGLYADECDCLEPVDVGTSLDEMGFDYIFGKESLTETVTMSRVTSPGTILAQYEIMPVRKILDQLAGATYQPDLLEFAALPFEFWRGDIIMVVEMLGSSINTARVAVCTHFGVTEAPDSLQAALGQYAHVFDTTAETNRFEVVLPYTSMFEWMRIPHGSIPPDRNITEYSTGLVTLRAVSRLTYTPAVTDEIDINIYFKAGDNFEVKWIGAGMSDIVVAKPLLDFELQAGDIVDAPANDQSDEAVTSVVAAPAGSPVVQAPENRGRYRSINDLVQRSTKSIINPSALFDISVTGLLRQNPYFDYYSNIFKIWKGGVSVVFASRGDTALTFAPDATTDGVDLTPSVGTNVVGAKNSQRGVPLVNCAGRNISLFTFLVNYMSPMKFMIIENESVLPVSFTNYGRVFGVTTSPDATASCGAYVAATDELRFSYLHRVPELTISSAYFPHSPVGVFIAPVSVVFTPAAEDAMDLKQEDIATFIRMGTFQSTTVTTFTVTTESWTTEMFEDYAGVIVPAGSTLLRVGTAARSWRSSVVPALLPSTMSVVQGPVDTIYQFDLRAVAVGNQIPYVDKRGVTGVAAPSFSLSFNENLGSEEDYAAFSGLVIPLGTTVLWPDGTTINVAAPTGPAFNFEGTTVFEWDFKNSLAFL